MNKFITTIAIASAAALAPASAAVVSAAGHGAGGVTEPAIYVDGDLYRTVNTPTDFFGTGAPAHSYDTIYAIDGQPNVATAAPGDKGYNGGRWQVRPVTIGDGGDAAYAAALAEADTNDSGDLDSDEELDAAVGAGLASIGDPIKSFLCPVIPVPGH